MPFPDPAPLNPSPLIFISFEGGLLAVSSCTYTVLGATPERSRPPMARLSAAAPSTGVPEFHSRELTAACGLSVEA